MRAVIVIPARYGSTRFPGKPLAMIAGKSMLERVADVARQAAAELGKTGAAAVEIVVATDDGRIADHCGEIGVVALMTPESCATGSDRVLAAVGQLAQRPDFVVNLQGDAPFAPPAAVRALIETFALDPSLEVLTPVHALSWEELDALREAKKTTPFSGTTAVLSSGHRALWFSKTILPAIRREKALREAGRPCPVWRHLGIYGFRPDILERFCALPPGYYEEIEGLEQLRLIENGIAIRAVPVELACAIVHSGIDSPEDIARAEAALRAQAGDAA